MRLFNMSISGLVIRFFIFMLIILAGAYLGLPWWLIILVGMLVFLSGFFGITTGEMKEPFEEKEESEEERKHQVN